MKINWLKNISTESTHDAFTDLNRSGDTLYLCFRRATDHHSDDGIVVLQQRELCGTLISHQEFSMLNSDLRDPKITIMENKRLLLTAYARKKETDLSGQEVKISQNIYWESDNGEQWQHKSYFAAPFHWCWRISEHKEQLYSLAYERKTESLYLYSAAALNKFIASKQPILSKAEHKLGYPNESDLCFTKQHAGNQAETHAIAIVRRDADTYSTQLGKSSPPFATWQWQDLPIYLASPRIVLLNKNQLLIAARYEHSTLTALSEQQKQSIAYFGCGNETIEYVDEELKTGLFTLNLHTDELSFVMPLPSADDNGYPGVVMSDNGYWISYYSSPEAGKTRVYLCYVEAL